MKYFVSFAYGEEGNIGVGNTQIEMDNEVATYEDITKMERKLGNLAGISRPFILNYKPIGQAAFEYTRCGDMESVKSVGNNTVFISEININVDRNLGAAEIAEVMKNALINQANKSQE